MLINNLFAAKSSTTPATPATPATPVTNPVQTPAAPTDPVPAPVVPTEVATKPAPVATKPTPSPSKKADGKKTTKYEYVAPKDATEAKTRIETAIDSKSVTSEQNGDEIFFYGRTSSLRECFRMLGGEWHSDKEANQYYWSIPVAYYIDPSTAIATKSEAAARHEAAIAALPAASIASIKRRMRDLMSPVFTKEYLDKLEAAIFAGIDY